MHVKQTGPISPEGKARSSMNALRQGYNSRSILIDGESPHEWRQHMTQIEASFPVKTPAHEGVVKNIAIIMWQLNRMNRLVENDVHSVSVMPITYHEIAVNFEKARIHAVDCPSITGNFSFQMDIDEGLINYLKHQKIVEAIGLWDDYQAGGDIQASELIDEMPSEVREVFDELASKKYLPIDSYVESHLDEQDQELIGAQLRILRRVSKDYMSNHELDRLKLVHWEASKSTKIFEAYNQVSYQRNVATLSRGLKRNIDLYQQLSTMHIDQVQMKKMPKSVLNHHAITDVDVTH
jgi:hypothetical protein